MARLDNYFTYAIKKTGTSDFIIEYYSIVFKKIQVGSVLFKLFPTILSHFYKIKREFS